MCAFVDDNSLEDFFSLSLDLLCIADMEGYFRKLSQSWEILGYPIDELIGKKFFDFIHPDDLLSTYQAIAQMSADVPVMNFTNRYRHQDGSYRLLEWRSQRRNGMIYAVARDVTDTQKNNQALEESELRYRTVVTTMSEGIVLHAHDGSIETCNTSAERILGLTKDQMMGRTSIDPLWRAIHEDGSPFPGETHPAVVTLQTGKPVANVVMGVHKPDGDLTWILINTQPIFSDDGQKPSAVVASFTDITTLKWMSESLQQSEYRFRIISEIISNYAYGFAVLPTGEVSREWLVGAFETITGYTSDEVDTQSLWISIIYPEDLPIANRRMECLLAGQESTDEFRIVTASGKILWIQDNSKPIWDDKAGRVVYIFGAARDITARKLAEQQKLDLTTERERINILADFITSTSHELRTPLSIINTSLYLLMHSQDETKRQTKARQITDQVSYLNNVINQLHEVVRLDRLNELEHTALSMRIIVEIFLNTYLPHKSDVVFAVDVPSDLPLIAGNDYYIHTVLEHVISNAIHFSAVGDTIRLSAHVDNGYVALNIADTGEGIAPQHLEHIFDPFYKASSARTHGDSGVGIGLTIVRRIMQLHHGRVAVQSQLGKGTTVTLFFPVAPSA